MKRGLKQKKWIKIIFFARWTKVRISQYEKNKDVYGMDDENVKAITMMGNDGMLKNDTIMT